MIQYYVAWWNVENLFDVESAPRSDKLKRTLAKELKGWNAAILNKKLSQLSKIITMMNNGAGPDILGVCEIENKTVLEKLVATISLPRNYKIAHEDAKDGRGIDVAFIYDSNLFELEKKFSHFIVKRSATRDIFQANLKVKGTSQLLVLVGNHWPSRMGGEYDSEPYRIMAGENLSYFHQRIVEENDSNVAVIAMGDFNDEPFNRSITNYALSTNDPAQLKRAKNPKFYNLMWPVLGKGIGTHYYGSDHSVLDQIMVSKGFLFGNSKFSVKPDSIKVEKISDMTSRGKPKRFGRPSSKKTFDKDGFSDHFPVSVIIERK